MNKIAYLCFIAEVSGVQYVVRFGKIDEFICLFLPSEVVITGKTTSFFFFWDQESQWYKRI